jgi:hypothetical protein
MLKVRPRTPTIAQRLWLTEFIVVHPPSKSIDSALANFAC